MAEMDKAESFAPLKRLGLIALFFGVVSAVAVTGLGISFAVSTSSPIKDLKDASERFSGGDLDYRVKVTRRDEIGILARSFNAMAEELKREITGHKRVEEVLRESEQRFRTIFDGATDGILIADTETKRFYTGNKAICQMIGYPAEEMKNLGIVDIHPKEDLPFITEQFEKQAKGEIALAKDIPVKRKDGSVFYADINTSLVTFEGKTYLMGIFRDITDRKRAEEALRKSEAGLANAQRIARLGNWEWDITRNELRWSDEIYRIFGLTPRSFGATYEAFLNFVHPDDRGFVKKSVNGALYEKKPYSIDHRIVLPDGSVRIVYEQAEVIFDNTGKAIQMNGTVQDITERKRIEEALKVLNDTLEQRIAERTAALVKANNELKVEITERKRAEEELRKLFNAVEQSSCSIVITDREGNIEYVNPKFVRITGYAPEEVIGQNPRVLKSGEKPSEEYKYLWDTITAGGEWEGEFHNKKKNGELYWEYASISPIRNPAGAITHFVAIKEDITERKRTEEALRKQRDHLEFLTNRLAAANKELEAFCYSVSHDLRAPLRGIDGFSKALMEDYSDKLDAQGKNYLRRVCAASNYMGQLIDDLLNLSRITRSEMSCKKVDLSALAKKIMSELLETEPGRQADFVIAEKLIVNGDPRLLQIALKNLLSNAWKFTRKRPRARIELGVMQHEGKTVYFVRDNGAGFDMAFVNKLFGAFQRLHSATEFEGTGIGLATVQRIIHRHGGQIWAEGAVDQGATFYFTI